MHLIQGNPAPLLISDREAASLLSMGRSTFWREVKAGNLPQPVKIGGLTRWRVADLQRCVDELRPDGADFTPLPATQFQEALLRRLDTVEWVLKLMAERVPKHLSRAQMCERLGITSHTLTNRLRRGEVPQPGPDGRWLLEEVMEWEARRQPRQL